MLAKMKCSNCGAEISNLNMSWGWKNYLMVVPIMLLGFLPLLRTTFFKGPSGNFVGETGLCVSFPPLQGGPYGDGSGGPKRICG